MADPKALSSALREKLNISTSYASELANGKRLPSLTLAVQIQEKLGIPASAWLDQKPVEDAA